MPEIGHTFCSECGAPAIAEAWPELLARLEALSPTPAAPEVNP